VNGEATLSPGGRIIRTDTLAAQAVLGPEPAGFRDLVEDGVVRHFNRSRFIPTG
jgi:hypothetical protein